MTKKVKKITESAFKNLIKEKVIQILGEEEVFPNTYDRRYPARGERILEKVTLNEGLVRTYPFEWVEDYISKHVNSDFTKVEADDDRQHFRFIIGYYRQFISFIFNNSWNEKLQHFLLCIYTI